VLTVLDWLQLEHVAAVHTEQFAAVVCHSTVRQSQRLCIEAAGTRYIIDRQDSSGCA
jgi:hypothetical protein